VTGDGALANSGAFGVEFECDSRCWPFSRLLVSVGLQIVRTRLRRGQRVPSSPP